MELSKIYNNNKKNTTSDEVYKSFNDFIFSPDIKVLGKLLYRYDFFNKVKHLPGDIVEVGVFKGSGVATFSKFLDIHCPNSNKKIIGFDIFNPDNSDNILNKDNIDDKNNMNIVYSRVNKYDRSLESVTNNLDNMKLNKKFMLIEGDVEDTLPKFLLENQGFRISLLYMDVDIERPTYIALKYLWDRILPGGVIVFDEYACEKWTESNAVDRFLKIHPDLSIKTLLWGRTPTAYIIKN
jgi:hypothetical protein